MVIIGFKKHNKTIIGLISIRSLLVRSAPAVMFFLLSILTFPIPALATTTVINFDQPQFSNGQVVTSASGVTFPDAPIIFQPFGVSTNSSPYALRSSQPCNDKQCSNNAYQLTMVFSQGANKVSLRAGSNSTWDNSITLFCFPEGTTCPIAARLIGYDTSDVPIADSRDVHIADALQGPITTEISIEDGAARIHKAILYVGKGTFSSDYGNPDRAQIDDLTFTVPDTVPPPPEPIRPPTITITSPQPGQSFSYPYQVSFSGKVTSPGGLFTFCTRINDATFPPANQCTQSGLVNQDGTFSIPIDPNQLRPGSNTLHAFVYDLSSQSGSAQVQFNLLAPPPPSVSIVYPKQSQDFTKVSDVHLTGEVNVPGGLLAFCTRQNNPTVPPLDQCTEAGKVNFYEYEAKGYFTSVPVPSSGLYPGFNTLYAFVYDRWGQIGSAQVQILLPTNTRITGMEVTQGIQREKIQLNTGNPVPYQGVKLIMGGKTVVRVFANQVEGEYTPRMYAFLRGTTPHPRWGEEPLGGLLPDNGPRTLMHGDLGVTYAERVDPDGAYVFTLPWSWTTHGSIKLQAVLNDGWGSVPECAGCESDNSMVVTDIWFEPRSQITISPVEIIWRDAKGNTIRPPADPVEVFSRTASISPLPEGGLDVRPYAGVIDITDLVNQNLDRDTLQDLVLSQINEFEVNHNLEGYTIGVVQGQDLGLEKPVTFCCWPPRVEQMAIVSNNRPLTSVAHEFYHQLAYYHAGLSCPRGFPTISWPPDDRGLIQGIGLDRQIGSGPQPGTYRIIAPGAPKQPAEWFDFMSYCANGEDDAWISVRNWDAFGSVLPNGAVPEDISIGYADYQPIGSASKPNEQTLRIDASVNESGKVNILHVGQGNGQQIVTGPQNSPYKLILRNQAGIVVSSNYLAVTTGHIDRNSISKVLTAEVPVGDSASLEITYNDTLIAQRARSINTPQVTIMNPKAGVHIPATGETIVRWQTSDPDGDPLEARVEYSTDDGKTFRVLTSGFKENQISLPNRLFSGSKQARLRVSINDGFNNGEAVSEVFQADGALPQVRIIDPLPNTSIRDDVMLHMVGQAYDDASRPIREEDLRWFAGSQLLGSGSKLSVSNNLTPGPVDIRLEARDTQGRISSTVVRIQILQTTTPRAINTTPTATPTKTSKPFGIPGLPGFGIVEAMLGLLAVSYLTMRLKRH
jgi:hypothetical protein